MYCLVPLAYIAKELTLIYDDDGRVWYANADIHDPAPINGYATKHMKLQIYIDSIGNCQIYKGAEHWDNYSTLFSGLTELPLPLIATQDGIVGVTIDCAVFKMPRPEGRVVVSLESLFENMDLKMRKGKSAVWFQRSFYL